MYGVYNTSIGSFNAALGSNLAISGSWSFNFGQNIVNEGRNSHVFGSDITIANVSSADNFVTGWSHHLESCNENMIGGVGHILNYFSHYNLIAGSYHTFYSSRLNIVGGSLHTLWTATDNLVSGYANILNYGAEYNIVSGANHSLNYNDGFSTEYSAIFGGQISSYGGAFNIIAGSNLVLDFKAGPINSRYNAIFGHNYTFRGMWSISSGANHAINDYMDCGAVFGIGHTIYLSSYCVVGGRENTLVGETNYAAIFGGYNTGGNECIVAGTNNISHGYNAVFGSYNEGFAGDLICGSYNRGNTQSLVTGYSNIAQQYSAVSGYDNTDSGSGYSVIGGQGNANSYGWSAVFGGLNSNAASIALVSGSQNNVAVTANGSIVGGYKASVVWPYSIAHSSGGWDSYQGALGDRLNTVDIPLEANTTNDSWTDTAIAYNSKDVSLMMRDHSVYLFDILILGTRKDVRGETKSWRLPVTAKREGTTITIDTATPEILSDASTLSWDIQAVSYGPVSGYYGIKIQVKGETGKTIYWQASARVVEINTTN
jgi:hypothetical protein